MQIEIVGELTDVETIARGLSVRDRKGLRKQFGGSRWRKLKVLRACGSQMVGYG